MCFTRGNWGGLKKKRDRNHVDFLKEKKSGILSFSTSGHVVVIGVYRQFYSFIKNATLR